MGRTADSTIKGFLYQFNKTIIEVARADADAEITVEGLIEDIDITSTNNVTAVQCKYHESAANFTDSLIFKPLLQMAESFSKSQTSNISYRIFIHVPNEPIGTRKVSAGTLTNALATQDEKLKKIVARIIPGFNAALFLQNVEIHFGPSLDVIEEQAKDALHSLNIKNGDVDGLLYPNSLSHIAKLSSYKSTPQRQITQTQLVEHLSKITTTLVSKWALASKTRDKILAAARRQLQPNLGLNSRERFFYFSTTSINDFDSDFIIFANDFLSKYHNKPAHTKTPLIALDCDIPTLKALEYRLFKKGIRAKTGIIGDSFEMAELFKEPISKQSKGKVTEREFDIRLCVTNPSNCPLNHRKTDDFFCVGKSIPTHIDLSDINTHHLDVSTLKELGYLMHLRETYE